MNQSPSEHAARASTGVGVHLDPILHVYQVARFRLPLQKARRETTLLGALDMFYNHTLFCRPTSMVDFRPGSTCTESTPILQMETLNYISKSKISPDFGRVALFKCICVTTLWCFVHLPTSSPRTPRTIPNDESRTRRLKAFVSRRRPYLSELRCQMVKIGGLERTTSGPL